MSNFSRTEEVVKGQADIKRGVVGEDPGAGLRKRQSAAHEMENILLSRLPSFQKTAYFFLGNTADAEDAVQDALLSACQHLDQFRGESQMSTWLTTIVKNCARMQLRRRPRQIHVSLDERIGENQEHSVSELLLSPGPNPEEQCRTSELNQYVTRLRGRLSPALRATFRLRDEEGLSIREAARILGLPSGTIKTQTARARTRLRKLMCRPAHPARAAGIRRNW